MPYTRIESLGTGRTFCGSIKATAKVIFPRGNANEHCDRVAQAYAPESPTP